MRFSSFAIVGFAAFVGGCATGGPDPRSAARNYVEAIRDNNISKAEGCLVIHGDSGSELRDVIVKMMIVPRQLNDAARVKFGQDLQIRKGSDLIGDDDLANALSAVESARVVAHGDDEAEIDDSSGSLTRVGLGAKQQAEKTYFGWRLVLPVNIGGPNPAQAVREGNLNVKVMQDVIDDIRSGKLKSIDAVTNEIADKCDEMERKLRSSAGK